jgi:hypothetical protein
MKGALMLTFMLITSQISYGQIFEQIALNFYVKEILSDQKSTKVLFDGSINPVDSQYQALGKFVIQNYCSCKVDPRGINNDKIQISIKEYSSIMEQLQDYKFEPIVKEMNKLPLQTPIKTRKNLKYRQLKGGIHFIAERFWHSIFPVKYILNVEPVVPYRGNYFVWIKLSKTDGEYGNWFFIKINNDGEVEDWCEERWIQ